MRHLSPRGAATADPSLALLWRAVESVTGQPAPAVAADPLSVVAVPGLLSVPVLGALTALVLSLVVAAAGWVLYRREDASGSEPAVPSASPTPPERSPSPPTVGDSTLSADEAFVVDLLERHDGRIRQSAIVEASEWSKSKVSRLLSNMERKGYVEKVTIGRENAIVLSFEPE